MKAARVAKAAVARLIRPRSRTRERAGLLPARYFYAVWLRHLVMAGRHGLNTDLQTVVELGPGDTLGLAIAALLSGVNVYYALDAAAYVKRETSARLLEEMLALYRCRARIPDNHEFPLVRPILDGHDFPHEILPDARLRPALAEERVSRIADALRTLDGRPRDDILVDYVAPWDTNGRVPHGCADAICSQAVMEYVEDLRATYAAMRNWLAPRGWISHTIDLSSHGTADTWDGHWAYGNVAWRIVRSTSERLNREPHCVHLELIRQAGFRVVGDLTWGRPPATPRRKLARPFRDLSDEDLATPECFIQAVAD